MKTISLLFVILASTMALAESHGPENLNTARGPENLSNIHGPENFPNAHGPESIGQQERLVLLSNAQKGMKACFELGLNAREYYKQIEDMEKKGKDASATRETLFRTIRQCQGN